jgi:membrane protein
MDQGIAISVRFLWGRILPTRRYDRCSEQSHWSTSPMRAQQQFESLWQLGGLTWRELLRRTGGGISQNDLINRAYELAFNFLFALFPLLLFLVALLGFFASEGSALRNNLLVYFQLLLPPDAAHLIARTLRETAENASSGKMTLGLLFALYAGTAGMTQLTSTLNAAYEVHESRSWIKVHLVSLALTLAMSVLMIGALLLVLFGGEAAHWIGHSFGLGTAVYILIKVLQWTFALCLVIVAFALIYYFAPDVADQRWYWITPGSTVGVLLWAATSAGFRVYLHFFNTYSATYGSLGAVIILMLWFYVSGLAMLVGGQINATIEHAAAEQGHPEAKAPGEKAITPEKAA